MSFDGLNRFITGALIVPGLIAIVGLMAVMVPGWYIQMGVFTACMLVSFTLAYKAIVKRTNEPAAPSTAEE